MKDTCENLNEKLLTPQVKDSLNSITQRIQSGINHSNIPVINNQIITRIIRIEIDDKDFLRKLVQINELPPCFSPTWKSKISKIKQQKNKSEKSKRKINFDYSLSKKPKLNSKYININFYYS